jgi:hypothetical protein
MSQFFQMPDGAPTFDVNIKPDFVPVPAIDSATTGSTHANADPHQGGISAVHTTMHEQPVQSLAENRTVQEIEENADRILCNKSSIIGKQRTFKMRKSKLYECLYCSMKGHLYWLA